MDILTYAMAKKYINKAIQGLGPIKGAPCMIKEQTEDDEYIYITFDWEDAAGDEEETTIKIKKGTDDYVLIKNKPQIEGNELKGNKTLKELNIASIQDLDNKLDVDSPVATSSFSLGRLEDSIIGDNSFAVGNNITASGKNAFAQGSRTIANGDYSHAEGQGSQAAAPTSHAEGVGSKATGSISHAEGQATIASGASSHSEGSNSNAIGMASHAEGSSIVSGDYAHGEGLATNAEGNGSHTEGNGTTSFGKYSHAEGTGSTANGDNSHSEGANTCAEGESSHTEGTSTNAYGRNSHAEGLLTTAGVEDDTLTSAQHAEGYASKAIGYAAHAEGYQTSAMGDYTHSGGILTSATENGMTAIGLANDPQKDSLFEVGNGNIFDEEGIVKTDYEKSNAFRVTKDGKAIAQTDVQLSDGTSLSNISKKITNMPNFEYGVITLEYATDTLLRAQKELGKEIISATATLIARSDTKYLNIINLSINVTNKILSVTATGSGFERGDTVRVSYIAIEY